MNKNKGFRSLIKLWIAGASLAALLSGWILLGHAGKPTLVNSATGIDPLPTIESLTIDSGSSVPVRPLPQQRSNFSAPRLRTGGS